MKREPNKLLFRIPFLGEVAAQGPVALGVVLVFGIMVFAGKWFGV